MSHRSRLLTEFERQRIENNLNQNENVTTTLMETEDIPIAASETIEKDSTTTKTTKDKEASTVESMETDDTSSVTGGTTTGVQRTISESEELDESQKIKEIEICISRVLDAFWTDHCKGQIIVPETASCYADFVDSNGLVDFDNLTFQIITEVVMQYFDGKRIDYKATNNSGGWETTANKSNQMELDNNCPGPMLAPHNLPNQGACSYLIQAYNRCRTEYDRYNGPKFVKRFGNSVLTTIYPLKEQIVRTVILLLNGSLTPQPVAVKSYRSVLLELLYENAVPTDFLQHLVEEASKEPKNMAKIFGTIMNNLFTDMQAKVVGKKLDLSPIEILMQLLSIKINGADGVLRPICNIVSKIYNFYPGMCTDTPGREIAKVSYLGPFLSVSVFSEENPKLFEDEDDDMKTNLASGMQLVSMDASPVLIHVLIAFFYSNWTICVACCTMRSTTCC